MKKTLAVLALTILIAVPAYSWQFTGYSTDSLGSVVNTFGFNFRGVFGQNYMLQGEVTNGIQDVDLCANLVWGEILITQRPNDYYYGSALVGFFQVPGSYQFAITNGGYDSGWSFYVGDPPADASISQRIDKRVK